MDDSQPAGNRVLWCCALVQIVALYVVGLVSHGVIRHIVQTVPLWVVFVLGRRRSAWTQWAAVPPFLIWLFLMTIVWLFLLGWTHVISGTFTPPEVAMTLVVGAASLIGTGAALRTPTRVSWPAGAAVSAATAGFQVFCLWLSFHRGIAQDPW